MLFFFRAPQQQTDRFYPVYSLFSHFGPAFFHPFIEMFFFLRLLCSYFLSFVPLSWFVIVVVVVAFFLLSIRSSLPPSSVLYAKHTDGFHNIAFDYTLLPFVLSLQLFSLSLCPFVCLSVCLLACLILFSHDKHQHNSRYFCLLSVAFVCWRISLCCKIWAFTGFEEFEHFHVLFSAAVGSFHSFCVCVCVFCYHSFVC